LSADRETFPSPDGASPLKVLYISSVGRSGTTLLSKILGQIPEFCDVGELWTLWRSAYAIGTCGCGLPVRDCPFWLGVVKSALGEDYESTGLRIGAVQRDMVGARKVPKIWLHVRGLLHSPDYDIYADALARQYRAVAEQSGASVVVDSSHLPGDAILASSISGITLYVLHLVRDPRGVAFSWTKDLDQTGNDVHSPQITSLRWLVNNIYANALVRPLVPHRFRTLRYEDLVADPREALQAIVDWVGEPAAELPMGDQSDQVILSTTHSVFGNRVRFRTGTVPLRPDIAWHQHMTRRDKAVATIVAAPFLHHYGFPFLVRPQSHSDRT